MSQLKSRFDWYDATLETVDDGRVPKALALAVGGELVRGKPRNGYAECWVVQRSETVLAQVYGRSSRHGEVHVSSSSESCDEVVPLLRRLYPKHRVSRADTAVDFASDFASLDAELLAFATARNLSHRLISSSDGGATRYVGAVSSEVRLRVYKKTEQLRAAHPERSDIPDGIVRFELQVRPGKREVKDRVSTMTADDVWGLSQWAHDLAAMMLSIDAERVSTHFRRPSDWSRAMHFLGQQYGPMIAARVAQVGEARARAEVLEALGLVST